MGRCYPNASSPLFSAREVGRIFPNRQRASIEAADGYRVALSLAALDAPIPDSGVMRTDKLEGHSFDDQFGPPPVVGPRDVCPGSWLRMIWFIPVVDIPQ
jgi:hypothetical protein